MVASAPWKARLSLGKLHRAAFLGDDRRCSAGLPGPLPRHPTAGHAAGSLGPPCPDSAPRPSAVPWLRSLRQRSTSGLCLSPNSAACISFLSELGRARSRRRALCVQAVRLGCPSLYHVCVMHACCVSHMPAFPSGDTRVCCAWLPCVMRAHVSIVLLVCACGACVSSLTCHACCACVLCVCWCVLCVLCVLVCAVCYLWGRCTRRAWLSPRPPLGSRGHQGPLRPSGLWSSPLPAPPGLCWPCPGLRL